MFHYCKSAILLTVCEQEYAPPQYLPPPQLSSCNIKE